jgi:hypothetical protein
MGWCGHQQLDRKSHGTERELRIPHALANHPTRSKNFSKNRRKIRWKNCWKK